MNIYLSVLLAFLPIFATGSLAEEQDKPALSILRSVQSQFPTEPVSIDGTISVMRRRGAVVKEIGYQIDATWKRDGGEFKCVFSDAFGRESDSVDVSFKAGDEPVIKSGIESFVDKAGRVKDTDLDCRDLAMPFLWWEDAELVGQEKSRGRDCFVMTLTPPGGADQGHVKVWIDNAIFIVLKAESYDKNDVLLKQVTVKSFKKVGEQWMIKDLELISGSAVTKTVVTVESMTVKKDGG